MFDTMETGIGLDVVLWFQGLRFGLLDTLITVLDFAGGELFYIAAIGLIYWVFNKQLGLRLFFMLITISLLTFALKDLLARPRPYELSAAITPLFNESSFGIPSGHTSITLAFWGYLALWLRKPGATVAIAIYVLLQAVSRMVAGVHFPQDVIGGLLLGAVVLAAYIALEKPVVQVWVQRTLGQQLLIVVIIALLITVLVLAAFADNLRRENYLTMTGVLLGGGVAAAIESRRIQFEAHAATSRRIAQYLLGLIVCIAVLFGLAVAFDTLTEVGLLAAVLRVIRYATVALVALAVWPYASIRAGLMQTHLD